MIIFKNIIYVSLSTFLKMNLSSFMMIAEKNFFWLYSDYVEWESMKKTAVSGFMKGFAVGKGLVCSLP